MYDVLLEATSDYYAGSLFDGELVTAPDGAAVYVLFDVVAATGFDLKAQPHSNRMDVVRAAAESIHILDPPIRFSVKDWHPLVAANTLLRDNTGSAIPADGLILVPEQGGLRIGVQHDMFKWKEAEHHTIDFLFTDGALNVHVNGTAVPASSIGVTLDSKWDAQITEGSVVECKCTRHGDAWLAEPVCVRTDKTRPNDRRIALLTLQNVDEAITVNELVACVLEKKCEK
jgi:hypothetical protein